MIQDINNAVDKLGAALICGASFRIMEISYKKYCILQFYGSAYNRARETKSMLSVLTISTSLFKCLILYRVMNKVKDHSTYFFLMMISNFMLGLQYMMINCIHANTVSLNKNN
jgi:hypothetical protein